jgi:hypothetical protein
MTIEELKIRADSSVSELIRQRNDALDRCANLMADLGVALAKIKILELKSKEQTDGEKL